MTSFDDVLKLYLAGELTEAALEQYKIKPFNPEENVTYYQWDNGRIVITPDCKPKQCMQSGRHGNYPAPKKVYWAWDRGLGAWIHYAANTKY